MAKAPGLKEARGARAGGFARPLGWCLALDVSDGMADEIGAWVAALGGAWGVELKESGEGQSARALVYFPDAASARRALRRARAVPVRGFIRAVEEGEAHGWLSAWRRTLSPVRVGCLEIRPVARLVAPRRLRRQKRAGKPGAPGTERAVVRIRPAMAFGTGHHPSTQQALWALQETLRVHGTQVRRVVDIGTGTGVLAIAAALLSDAEVVAVDPDPAAVREARAHVRAHGLHRRVRVLPGSVEVAATAWGWGRADLAVANLVAPVLVELAADLARVVCRGGRVIGAGVSPDQLGGVVRAWQQAGMQVELCGEWSGWAWLEAVRK